MILVIDNAALQPDPRTSTGGGADYRRHELADLRGRLYPGDWPRCGKSRFRVVKIGTESTCRAGAGYSIWQQPTVMDSSAGSIYGQLLTHNHSASGIFAGLPNPTALISYHPWRLVSMAPTELAFMLPMRMTPY